MCCGNKRHDAARNAAPVLMQSAPHPAQGRAAPPSGEQSARAAAAVAGGAGPVFVHDGTGELILTGAKTGRRYRFAGRGARLTVDALDAPALAQVDKLRRLA